MRKKVELHLHFDGSLSGNVVKKLAKEQGIALPTEDVKELENKYLTVPISCNSLNDYLKCFDLPLSVLQTKSAIQFALIALIESLDRQQIKYAEIRFAPSLHLKKGLTMEEIVKAVSEAVDSVKNRLEIEIGIILCAMRSAEVEQHRLNFMTVELAAKYRDKGIVGVDLAGAEGLFETQDFADIFEEARKLGLNITIHAGEAAGAESVRKAIEFGAKRIGHGIRIIEDEKLIQEVIDRKIVLEMCPTSNLQTKAVKDIASHPIKTLYDRGVRVTVNVDNMTVSATSLDKEYSLIMKELGFTEKDIEKIQNYAYEARFV